MDIRKFVTPILLVIIIVLQIFILKGGISRKGDSSFFYPKDTLIIINNEKEITIIDSLKNVIENRDKNILNLTKSLDKLEESRKIQNTKIDSMKSTEQSEYLHNYLKNYEY